MIDIHELESELTDFFGGLLMMETDREIFRGEIPENVRNGVCVRVSGGALQGLVHNEFSLQLFGKFCTRDAAWEFLADASRILPAYGRTTDSFLIQSMVAEGDAGEPFKGGDAGRMAWYASVNARISVLTKPALSEV